LLLILHGLLLPPAEICLPTLSLTKVKDLGQLPVVAMVYLEFEAIWRSRFYRFG
jgi:hypothetical protein